MSSVWELLFTERIWLLCILVFFLLPRQASVYNTLTVESVAKEHTEAHFVTKHLADIYAQSNITSMPLWTLLPGLAVLVVPSTPVWSCCVVSSIQRGVDPFQYVPSTQARVVGPDMEYPGMQENWARLELYEVDTEPEEGDAGTWKKTNLILMIHIKYMKLLL